MKGLFGRETANPDDATLNLSGHNMFDPTGDDPLPPQEDDPLPPQNDEHMNSLSDIFGAIGNVATAYAGRGTAKSPVVAKPNAWLPYAIGGGVLLVVVLFFASKRR